APQLAASFLSGVVAPQASIHAQGQAQGSLYAGDPQVATAAGPSARRSLASTSAAMLSALSSFAAFAPLSERAALPGFAPQAGFAPQSSVAPQPTGGAPLALEGEGGAIASRIAALAPGAEYVAPDALEAAPTRAPFRSFADAIDREHAPERPPVAPVAATAMTAGAPSVAPTDEALATADASSTAPAVAAMIARMPTSQLLALRSTLLAEPNRVPSLTGGSDDTIGAFVGAGAQPSFATRASAWVGADAASASLIDSPLAEAPRGAGNGAPGMTATMAQAWAVEQERTSADLAFDFLPPELVLAARVYGFGPVEAAQAQRLAVSGASGLAAMATALDLTFLRAVHTRDVQRDQHGQRDRAAIAWDDGRAPLGSEPRTVAPITAYPAASPAIAELAPISGTTAASTQAPAASAQIGAPAARAESYLPAPGERSALFGIQRRLPRGAFLWPSATVASIGLNATAPEGFETLSVAALELLAASAVADLGAWVVGLDPQQRAAGPAGRASESSASADGVSSDGGESPAAARTAFAMLTGNLSAARPAEPSAFTGASDTRSEDEPSLAEVARVVPSERRGRFEAVYLSLTQTSTGRSLSPSARVARALAMLGRDDGSSPATPIERAAEAWSVLPLLLTGDGQPMATGEVGERPRAAVPTEGRPGLQVLSGRAGEALGSFVAPSAAEIDTTRGGHREREERAERAEARERERDERERVREERREKRERERASRMPATPEFVRTGGLPRTRAGGGEAEIPAWFESAARSMLNERSAGPSDGISMAELTLINAAPTSHVAASTRGTSAATAPASPSGAGGQSASGGGGEKPDVDGLAQKVYSEILKLIDIERERNGEPYR
ncbi:MAG: hypothetical protein K8W52_31480, partial [Deltaproteobacteria bacterium]|nr:hypothetical protein [Deltaproteobacteria bacterium]